MSQLDDLVTNTVALSGGELVGRIRMQKVIYLLDQLGMKSGAAFEYHHYGPYSEAVSDAVTDAKFWGKLKEAVSFRVADGAPYSTFKTSNPAPAQLGNLSADNARHYLGKFAECSSTVLELAATAHWLDFKEHVPDWRAELEVRKAGKTGSGRLEQAVALLRSLGLPPKARNCTVELRVRLRFSFRASAPVHRSEQAPGDLTLPRPEMWRGATYSTDFYKRYFGVAILIRRNPQIWLFKCAREYSSILI